MNAMEKIKIYSTTSKESFILKIDAIMMIYNLQKNVRCDGSPKRYNKTLEYFRAKKDCLKLEDKISLCGGKYNLN